MVKNEREVVSDLLHRLESHVGGGRILVGIAGGPGAGKSTFAHRITNLTNEAAGREVAAMAPMDGFHFPNKYLREKNIEHLKGAPSTFDTNGFVDLMKRLKFGAESGIGIPSYSREIHEAVPNAWFAKPFHKIIIAEGNYLLLNENGWRRLKDLLDLKLFIDTPRSICRERLIERQLKGGKSIVDARRKVEQVDLVNYDTVHKSIGDTDVIVTDIAHR